DLQRRCGRPLSYPFCVSVNTLDEAYHYPPEVLTLLADAIAVLNRSKRDVLRFFGGAGVPVTLMADLAERIDQDPESVRKHELAREILARLNERGEPLLRVRRELIKRVAETDSFAMCWPDQQMKAKGLVAEVRDVVNVKDSFTRMRMENERLAEEHRRQKA